MISVIYTFLLTLAMLASSARPDCTSQVPSGAVYVRWGKSECHFTAKEIYKGLAAAPDIRDIGGAAEYLCLPETPTYDEFEAGVQGRTNGVYGVEYRFDFPPLQSVVDHDVPCVVCEANNGRSSVLMVPAKNSCPGGWTMEYYGYLMAERGDEVHYRAQYVCVDRNPSTRREVEGEEDRAPKFAAMEPVEGRCSDRGGGLPCPPYINGHELTCAVCTK